uniref:Cyclic nucleotide-binding domain-containing protein n=1 Tax=Parascaris equorum TaxID=6256 RepID=A0A914R241_PAREQ
MNDPKTVIPRTAKLYTKQEPSERFILILEGRAMVTIGQVFIRVHLRPSFSQMNLHQSPDWSTPSLFTRFGEHFSTLRSLCTSKSDNETL